MSTARSDADDSHEDDDQTTDGATVDNSYATSEDGQSHCSHGVVIDPDAVLPDCDACLEAGIHRLLTRPT